VANETLVGGADKILLEVLRNRFQAIVDEMGYVVLRTGHTVFVKETGDFGVALAARCMPLRTGLAST
jgi:N-methylhydantoinase B/oxoprolinase/acetone carboxylase alpha subunit